MKKSLLLILLLTGCGNIGPLKNQQAPSAGIPGTNGVNGTNGHSAVFTTEVATNCPNGGTIFMSAIDANDNGVLDSNDSNIQTSVICNGVNAQPSPFTPVQIVDPCGTAPGIQNEVFLKLSNGSLLASFSDSYTGVNTRFSILRPGTYQTTDGDNCIFSVDSNGNVYNENHHY